MEFDTTTNLIHLNGIQLIKIIQYLILIYNMTICRMYDIMTYYDTLSYTYDNLSSNKQINTYREQIGNTLNYR